MSGYDLDFDELTYEIVENPECGTVDIELATGAFTYTPDPNENGTDTFTYTATDGNGGTDVQLISVTVTDVNETPTDIVPNGFSVDENTDTSGGYSLGTLATTDEDSAETFTYTIVGGADQAKFSIGGASNDELILTDGILNHEAQASYQVTVRTTDAGGLSYDETLTVSVNDLNEAPTITSTAVTSATEDAAYSYSITTTDPDTGAVLSINATTLPAWLTLTDNGNGTATLSGTPTNAEVGAHAVVLEVSDGSLTDTQSFTITVGNTNDAPTITSDGGGATASVSAAENQTAVTTVTASDVDVGYTPAFSISGGADAGLFNITAGGVLTFNTGQDFETYADNNSDGVYEVEVTADDGNGGTDVQLISVTVTDVNETPTDITPNGFSVDENTDTSGGYSLGSLASSDEDGGETFTYTIVGGADQAKFGIGGAGNDELILSDGVLDYETRAGYAVTVRTTDANGLSYDEALTVTLAVSLGQVRTLIEHPSSPAPERPRSPATDPIPTMVPRPRRLNRSATGSSQATAPRRLTSSVARSLAGSNSSNATGCIIPAA